MAPATMINIDTNVIILALGGSLRRVDFESDPADQIITATSVAHTVPVLTRDSRILASSVPPLAVRP